MKVKVMVSACNATVDSSTETGRQMLVRELDLFDEQQVDLPPLADGWFYRIWLDKEEAKEAGN